MIKKLYALSFLVYLIHFIIILIHNKISIKRLPSDQWPLCVCKIVICPKSILYLVSLYKYDMQEIITFALNLTWQIKNMRNKDFKDRLTELSAYVAKKVMVSLFMLGSVASAQMNTYPQVYSSYPQIYFYYGTDFTPTGLDTSKLELKVSHTFDSESVAFTKNDT